MINQAPIGQATTSCHVGGCDRRHTARARSGEADAIDRNRHIRHLQVQMGRSRRGRITTPRARHILSRRRRMKTAKQLTLRHPGPRSRDTRSLYRRRLQMNILEDAARRRQRNNRLPPGVTGHLCRPGIDGKNLVVVRPAARRLEVPSSCRVLALCDVPCASSPRKLQATRRARRNNRSNNAPDQRKRRRHPHRKPPSHHTFVRPPTAVSQRRRARVRG